MSYNIKNNQGLIFERLATSSEGGDTYPVWTLTLSKAQTFQTKDEANDFIKRYLPKHPYFLTES